MIWLSEKLRKILTPPDPEAELKAAIAFAQERHAASIHLQRAHVQAKCRQLAGEL